MSFTLARGLIAHLISFVMILQGIEILQMIKDSAVYQIWSRDILEPEMRRGLPLPLSWIDHLLDESSFQRLAWAEIALGAIALIHPSALVFLLLFLIHLLLCVRFRGSINGGSDSMTAIVLIGLFLAYLFKKESFACMGLLWIAVNLLLSYLRAGIAKVQHPEWRDGTALPMFLEQSFFADIRAYAKELKQKPELAQYLCRAVIAVELTLILTPFAPKALLVILIFVALFHFAIYWAFGLNRFFWAWITAWPSVFYIARLIEARAAS